MIHAGSISCIWFFFLALCVSEMKKPWGTNKTSSYLCFFCSIGAFKKCKREEKWAKKDKSRKPWNLSSALNSAFSPGDMSHQSQKWGFSSIPHYWRKKQEALQNKKKRIRALLFSGQEGLRGFASSMNCLSVSCAAGLVGFFINLLSHAMRQEESCMLYWGCCQEHNASCFSCKWRKRPKIVWQSDIVNGNASL